MMSSTKTILYWMVFGLGWGGYIAAKNTVTLAPTEFAPNNSPDNPKSAPDKVREHFNAAYRHLDEFNAILQYIVQLLNKNIIQPPNKKAALRWIGNTQEYVVELMHLDEGSAEDLNKAVRSTRALLKYLDDIIRGGFREWIDFEPPVIRSPQIDGDEEAIFIDFYLDNDQMLREMRASINDASLTTVNKIARKLDDWNNRFHFTSVVEKLPAITAIGYFSLLLTPKRWLSTTTPDPNDSTKTITTYTPGLGTLKRWIGSIGGDDDSKPFTVHHFLGSEERKSFETVFKIVFAFGANTAAQNFIDSYRPTMRNWWNGLKGLDIPSSAHYKYPTITLDSPLLIGLENQIAEMRRVEQYIADPESFDRTNSNLEKGILLTGPSRSGKTLLAEALCGSLNKLQREKGNPNQFKFITLRLDEVRWNVEGIKSIIKAAKADAPCILFIDEIHNLPLQTKEGQNGDILTQFLTMSESLMSESVIVLGATNRVYMLDDSLLKPGRFGLVINFEEPTFINRKKFFEVYFKESAINPQNFDVQSLARQTAGASYGDLVSLFKTARFEAQQDNRSVTQNDFQQKIYRKIYRLQLDKELPLTQQEKALLAAHQAGHAFMHLLYEDETDEVMECVTIRGRWRKSNEMRFFEHARVQEEHAKKKTTYGRVIKTRKCESVKVATNPVLRCKIRLAGHIAEKILLGTTQYSYHEKDKRKALDELEKIAFEGLKKEDYTKEEQKERCQKAFTELKKYEQETYDELLSHKALLESIAVALEQKELLTAQEVRDIMVAGPDRERKVIS